MEIVAKTRYVKMSPEKAHDIARAIQGRTVAEALAITSFNKRKAAREIGKTLRSAIANAENNAEIPADDLTVKEAVINQGPMLKRYWPRARGMVSPIKRRTSHIHITLTDEKKTAGKKRQRKGA